MNQASAHKAVIISATGTVAVVTISKIGKGEAPKPGLYIAGGFAFVILAVLADTVPEIAEPFAYLVLVGALLLNGGDFFNRIVGGTRFKGGVPTKPQQKMTTSTAGITSPGPVPGVTHDTGTSPAIGSAPWKGAEIVALAKHYVGTPYLWGGNTPAGFDCSGFVQYLYSRVGVSLPHQSEEQWRVGIPVSYGQLMPGDPIFFDIPGDSQAPPNHEGLYIGANMFIQAPKTGTDVQITPLTGFYRQHLMGGRRITKP